MNPIAYAVKSGRENLVIDSASVEEHLPALLPNPACATGTCAPGIGVLTREEYDVAAADFHLTPFQESRWLEALSGAGRRPAYFDFRHGAERVGIAGGVEISSPWRPLAGVSRCLYLYGMPPMQPGRQAAMMESFTAFLRQRGFNTLELAPYYNAPPPYVPRPAFRPRLAVEYRLDLALVPTELRRGVKRERHYLMNRAKKSDLVYDESQGTARLEALLTCMETTRHHRAGKGFGAYNPYYIPGLNEAAVRRLLEGGLGYICTVSQQGRILSAMFVIANLHHAYCILDGATEEGYVTGAFKYMMWCAIERSKAAGCRTVNLGGVPKDESGPRLADYKRSFGAEAHECEGGTCFLVGPWPTFLHRCYKLASRPRSVVQLAADTLQTIWPRT